MTQPTIEHNRRPRQSGTPSVASRLRNDAAAHRSRDKTTIQRTETMPKQEIIYYIEHESNSDLIYLIAVTCIERLTKLGKVGVIKAILDSGTATLCKMIPK